MGKNSRSKSAVSQAKHFVLGAGLVLVLATVLPVLAQQVPGGGGGGAPPPGGGGSSPVINLPSLGNLTTPGLPFTPTTSGGAQGGQGQQPPQNEQGGQEQKNGAGLFPGQGATEGLFPGKGATLGKFPGIGKGVGDEKPKAEYKKGRESEETSGKFLCESLGAEATKEECDAADAEKGLSKKDFGDALKKASKFGKQGITPLPFKKSKTTEEGTAETAPTETSTETPTPQYFDPKQYKQFLDKDLMKLFGKGKQKEKLRPTVEILEIEEGGGLEEDLQVLNQNVEKLIKSSRNLSKKKLREYVVKGIYSQVARLCEEEDVDCSDEMAELKFLVLKGKGSKQEILRSVKEVVERVQEKLLSGGEEEGEEEFFEEEEF